MTVIHADPENSKEYEDTDAKVIGIIPAPEEWESDSKQLVVVDDLDVARLSTRDASALDRLFGYVSTHKNISVILYALKILSTYHFRSEDVLTSGYFGL